MPEVSTFGPKGGQPSNADKAKASAKESGVNSKAVEKRREKEGPLDDMDDDDDGATWTCARCSTSYDE